MVEMVRCAECGGVKVECTGHNQYRCMYCGASFIIKSEMPEASAQLPATAPQVIIVNQTPVENQGPSPEELRKKEMKKARRDITVHVIVCVLSLIFSLIEFSIYDSFIGRLFGTSQVWGFVFIAVAIINGIMAIYKYLKYKNIYG